MTRLLIRGRFKGLSLSLSGFSVYTCAYYFSNVQKDTKKSTKFRPVKARNLWQKLESSDSDKDNYFVKEEANIFYATRSKYNIII